MCVTDVYLNQMFIQCNSQPFFQQLLCQLNLPIFKSNLHGERTQLLPFPLGCKASFNSLTDTFVGTVS